MTVLFFGASAALAGAVLGLELLGSVSLTLEHGVFYSKLDLRLLLVVFAACYFVLSLFFRRIGQPGGRTLARLEIELDGGARTLTALVDTGHSLTDPGNNRPVVVADAWALAGLLPEWADPADPIASVERCHAAGGRQARLIPYRAVGVEAPLRETLAAAMVLLSRYRGRDPFRDPFCGSGTIAIEAALIAKNRAPGLDRSFDAQRWSCVDSRLWLDAAGEAMDREFDGQYDVWGGDIDPKAVRIARENAVKAGVEDLVRFETADAARLRCQGEYGQIVTNPPYGERMLEKQEAEALYAAFGQAYRSIPPKWRVLVLTSHPEFERFFGRKADKKRKLYNGMMKCELYQFTR